MPRPTSALPSAPRPTLPISPQDYYGFLRTERYRWWKGLLGIVALLVGLLVLGAVFGTVGLIVDVARGDIAPDQLTPDRISSGELPMGPAFFIANNVAVAGLIPLSMLLNRLIFGQQAGWLSSVTGAFRWRWLLWCLLVVGLPWLALNVIMTLLAPGTGAAVTLTASVLVILALTLVTTPLQSAGEEWAFRGFIPRCIAAMVPNATVGLALAAAVSSAIFMVSHLAADPWLNGFYFCLGLIFSALAWRSGGLEAAVTLHAVNNVSSLVPVILTDQLGSSMDRSVGAGNWTVLPFLAVGVLLVLVVDRIARHRGVARVGARGLAELAAPGVPAQLPYVPSASAPTGGPTEHGGAVAHSEIVASRVTLEPHEHRDDPQPGADDRRT